MISNLRLRSSTRLHATRLHGATAGEATLTKAASSLRTGEASARSVAAVVSVTVAAAGEAGAGGLRTHTALAKATSGESIHTTLAKATSGESTRREVSVATVAAVTAVAAVETAGAAGHGREAGSSGLLEGEGLSAGRLLLHASAALLLLREGRSQGDEERSDDSDLDHFD